MTITSIMTYAFLVMIFLVVLIAITKMSKSKKDDKYGEYLQKFFDSITSNIGKLVKFIPFIGKK